MAELALFDRPSRSGVAQHKTCPLCGAEISHGTEMRYAEGQRMVMRLGRIAMLTPAQFRIFFELMDVFPRAANQDRLIYLVWGDEEVALSTVKVHLCNMNKALKGLGIKVNNSRGNFWLSFSNEAGQG